MKKIDLKQLTNLKPNPLFKNLPDSLKDPKIYAGIEDELKDLIKSDHQHKTVSSYVKCNECQSKFHARRKKLKELGFSSIQQYVEWKKVMEAIKNKIKIRL